MNRRKTFTSLTILLIFGALIGTGFALYDMRSLYKQKIGTEDLNEEYKVKFDTTEKSLDELQVQMDDLDLALEELNEEFIKLRKELEELEESCKEINEESIKWQIDLRAQLTRLDKRLLKHELNHD